jgi:succinyl-CoA synthetase beta subunit
LLREAGIRVPAGTLLRSIDDLKSVPDTTFPSVLKAQVPIGGRMKAGGILFAKNRAEAAKLLPGLLSMTISGFAVQGVLAEPQAPVEKEYYLGITYDQAAKDPVAIFSAAGGIDVETATAIRRTVYPLVLPTSSFRFKELLAPAELGPKLLGPMTQLFTKLADFFAANDCTLAEINPLAELEDGSLMVLDAHVDIDDDALYRHSALTKRFSLDDRAFDSREKTELESAAEAIDSADHRGVAGRVVEFPGTLALLIGGGGASLTAFDAVQRHGGEPADYCEIGGNPSVWKVKELTKLLMSQPDVTKIAVIMNVVSNTRVDLVARGVVKAMLELGLDPSQRIAVFRIPGAWEEDGFAILRKYGVKYVDRTVSIDEAARLAVVGGDH